MAEIRFTREDVTGVGDAAAAGTDTEATGVSTPPPPPTGEAAGESPAAADRRASESGGDRPEIAILGAFVGAFVAAKVLDRLTGGND
jgi:hypothetical protein